MTTKEKMNSIKRATRVAGILYLIIFFAVPFAFTIGRATIIVPGDATTTANNIVANEFLFRMGIVGDSIVFLVEIILAAYLFALLKPVSEKLSLVAAFSRLAEAIVQSVNVITSIFALLLVSGAGYLNVLLSDQLNALAMLFLEAYDDVILIWGLFFGLHLFILGYLVFRSGYFPRILGILLLFAGVGYFVESFGSSLFPQTGDIFAAIVFVLALPGELAFALWLLIKGVDLEKWEKRALESAL